MMIKTAVVHDMSCQSIVMIMMNIMCVCGLYESTARNVLKHIHWLCACGISLRSGGGGSVVASHPLADQRADVSANERDGSPGNAVNETKTKTVDDCYGIRNEETTLLELGYEHPEITVVCLSALYMW